MYKKKLRRFDNYSKEDELETVFVRLKTKLDLLKEIKDIFKDNMDPTIQKQIKIAQQETRQDIKKLTDFGVSLVDIYSRIGGNIFKAEVLQANEYLQMVASKQEDHVIDLVNEDQELLRQNQRRQQRLNALQDPVAWQQVQERRVYGNNPLLVDKPREESISLRSFLEGLNNEQEPSNEEEKLENIYEEFQSANSSEQNIENYDLNDNAIEQLLEMASQPNLTDKQLQQIEQLYFHLMVAPTIDGQPIPQELDKERMKLAAINPPLQAQNNYQELVNFLHSQLLRMRDFVSNIPTVQDDQQLGEESKIQRLQPSAAKQQPKSNLYESVEEPKQEESNEVQEEESKGDIPEEEVKINISDTDQKYINLLAQIAFGNLNLTGKNNTEKNKMKKQIKEDVYKYFQNRLPGDNVNLYKNQQGFYQSLGKTKNKNDFIQAITNALSAKHTKEQLDKSKEQ